MSKDPDKLELAEQRGWEQGKKEGRDNGLAIAACIVQDEATAKFLFEKDNDAEMLRALAKQIRAQIVEKI